MKYAILLAAVVAFVKCSSEMRYGIMTIRYILSYYNDQLVPLQSQFDENIHKYLEDLESRALQVSEALKNCVHEGVPPIEDKLVQEVKEALESESQRIMGAMVNLENLGAEEVDKLWTSVSHEGAFRNEMNKMIMGLKSGVLQQLEEFKIAISTKCSPIAAAPAGPAARKTQVKVSSKASARRSF